jgi:opacity protein-like surface antigen
MTRFISTLAAVLVATALQSDAYGQEKIAAAQAAQPAGQVSPQPAFGPEPEYFTLTPFVDVSFGGDYQNSPAGIGAAIGYGINNRLSLEGEFSLTPEGEAGAVAPFDVTVFGFSGNVLYHFVTAQEFTPYVTLGVGALGADSEADDLGLVNDGTQWHMAMNWGAGIKTGLSGRVGFRGDARYFNGDELVPDHWRLYAGLTFRRIGLGTQ